MTNMKRFAFICALLCASLAHAGTGDLESILNAFIATYAKSNVNWKKDIVLTQTPQDIEPGRQLGLSKIAGYYTFVPKTWEDLNEVEQHDLMNDQRLTAFIINLRQVNLAPPGADGKAPMISNGLPMFPVEGVSIHDVARDSAVIPGRKRVIEVELTAAQLAGAKEFRIQSLK